MNGKQICVCKSNIDDSLKQIWKIESYGVSKETSEILLPKTKQKAIKILDKTVCKETFEHRLDEILWKKEINELPYNQQIAVSRLKSLEHRFKKEPEFCQKYQETSEN